MRAALPTRAFALLIIALCASTVSGQQVTSTLPQRDQLPVRQTGSGVIRGRVIAADTNAPLRRVQIRLLPMTAENGEPHLTTTGDDGRYEFTQLPAGRYGLRASKGGYVDVEYGQRRPFEKGRPVEIADRQTIDRVELTLTPGGVVTGRVTDETGELLARAWVQMARYRYFNGKRRLIGNYGDNTDDRGEFRIFGIPPGEYLLSASFSEAGDRSTDKVRYVRTFYPGTASPAEAQHVTVKPGGEIASLSVALVRQRSASVSGVVRSTTPSPIAFVHARRADGDDSDSHFGTVDSRGAFSIAGLLPGSYVLEVENPFGKERASADVKVDASDVAGLVLTMSAGASARGQVRFEGGAPPRDLQPSQVFIVGDAGNEFSGGHVPSPIRSDWTFELTGLHGRQVLMGGGGRDWFVKTVSVAGNDFTDVPIDFSNGDVNGIEVVLSNRQTEVAGRVTDIRGVVAGDATVVVFSADPEKWTRRGASATAARPDQQGRFHVDGLRAGRYLAIAVDYLEDGEEQNPDLLKEWARIATSFTLADGEKRNVDLRVVSTN
jgi:hypothetical protein